MDIPPDASLPFFAYGIFQPGQIAYFQLREYVKTIDQSAYLEGRLMVRDGLPILDPSAEGLVCGALLTFHPEKSSLAYAGIAAMEPRHQYYWQQSLAFNVLVGRSPSNGSTECEEGEWDSWDDPCFVEAMEVVEETLQQHTTYRGFKDFFRVQMAYLLLWSSIERYVSLRYHLGSKVTDKVFQLAEEPAFRNAVQCYVASGRKVHRADDPSKNISLKPSNPQKALGYYYQVRSNITHRGKGLPADFRTVYESLAELFSIFRQVLEDGRRDAATECRP